MNRFTPDEILIIKAAKNHFSELCTRHEAVRQLLQRVVFAHPFPVDTMTAINYLRRIIIKSDNFTPEQWEMKTMDLLGQAREPRWQAMTVWDALFLLHIGEVAHLPVMTREGNLLIDLSTEAEAETVAKKALCGK